MKNNRNTGGRSYRPKKELEKLNAFNPSTKNEIQVSQPRRKRNKQWVSKQRMQCIFFVDFHKKNIQEWIKKIPKKLFDAMSSFIKTKTASQCETFIFQTKQRILSFEDWIKDEKQMMGLQNYMNQKNKFIDQLVELKVDKQSYTYEEIMMHRNQKFKQVKRIQQLNYLGIPNNMRNIENFMSQEQMIKCNSKMYQYQMMVMALQKQRIQSTMFDPTKFPYANPNLNPFVNKKNSSQMQEQSISQEKKQIIKKCEYHWKEWLKSVTILEVLKTIQYEQTNNCIVKKQEMQIEQQK